jgi:hypothetical protein
LAQSDGWTYLTGTRPKVASNNDDNERPNVGHEWRPKKRLFHCANARAMRRKTGCNGSGDQEKDCTKWTKVSGRSEIPGIIDAHERAPHDHDDAEDR